MSPLWLVGFRPFFTLAVCAGMVLPLMWAMVFSGVLPPLNPTLSPTQWHAHEMFYGFAWAVLGGFLLTSTKNWVSVRGVHGLPLAGLTVAWVVERVAINTGADWSPIVLFIASFGFLLAIIGLLLWTLIRYRQQDSYADNVFFMLLLPCFLVAKFQMLYGDFSLGINMTVALFRLAFLLMLERTLTQFMKGVFQVSILRHAGLDNAIKTLALVLVGGGYFPPWLVGFLSALLSGLLLFRFVKWHPKLALQRIDIGVMYVGYLAIVGQLVLEVVHFVIPVVWVGTVSIHLFTLGAIGVVTPAMIIRIARGHTGRKVVFDVWDRTVLYLMLLAFLVRILVPQWLPVGYTAVIHLTATLWLSAFSILAWRYLPFLFQPRVDGKVH